MVGADIDPRVVDLVNAGTEPFPGEAGLGEAMSRVVGEGLLSATTDVKAAVAESEAVVLVVPLFVDAEGQPDFRAMDAATRDVAAGLQAGTLVSYETTLPVGTTRTRWAPLLSDGSGLTPGKDFHLVFSPERVLTGRVFADLRRYPKLVGGIDEASARAGIDFYEAVLNFDERPDLDRPNGVWDLGSAEAAELAKLAETTYRDVNIGLANQFARYAGSIGVDVMKVIEACNTQPYSHIHLPGIAVGGHCIPVYPRLYLWNDPDATVVSAARAANASMPAYAVDLLAAALGDLAGVSVLVLGASYRGGVKETAFSGVYGAVAELRARGAHALRLRPDVHVRGARGARPAAAPGRAGDRGGGPGRPRGVPDAHPRRPARRRGDRRRPPGHRPRRVGRQAPDRDRRLSRRVVGERAPRNHPGCRTNVRTHARAA